MFENWQPWWDVLLMATTGVILVTWLVIEGEDND